MADTGHEYDDPTSDSDLGAAIQEEKDRTDPGDSVRE